LVLYPQFNTTVTYEKSMLCLPRSRRSTDFSYEELVLYPVTLLTICMCLLFCAEPDRQFAMIEDHIKRLRSAKVQWQFSAVEIYVERNLGFEAEHHKLALQHLPRVSFRMDPGKDRVGVYTTQPIKHAMATLLNTMMRDQRVHILHPVVTEDQANLERLREQLNVYSYQFKLGVTTFQTDKCAISGKIGGMKDDICIALQLGVYFTDVDSRQE
jgi:hypothetical protein